MLLQADTVQVDGGEVSIPLLHTLLAGLVTVQWQPNYVELLWVPRPISRKCMKWKDVH